MRAVLRLAARVFLLPLDFAGLRRGVRATDFFRTAWTRAFFDKVRPIRPSYAGRSPCTKAAHNKVKHGLAGSTSSNPANDNQRCYGKRKAGWLSTSGRLPTTRSSRHRRNHRSLGKPCNRDNHGNRGSHRSRAPMRPACRPWPTRYFPCRIRRTSPG